MKTTARNHQPVFPVQQLHDVMKQLALRATPGKYCFARSGRTVNVCGMTEAGEGKRSIRVLARLPVSIWRTDAQIEADAEFMSMASPEHVLQLVDTIEAHEQRIARLESLLAECRGLIQEARKCG